MNRGFSLVELSIVLVILGLLTGGILAGQNLIRAAELRSIGTELTRYKSAVQSFQDQYSALPGDMMNAYAYWGVANGCTNADVSVDPNGCNGNGNGNVPYNNEAYRFWQHLANAGLIEGKYTGTATSNNAILDQNIPSSRIKGAGHQVVRDTYASQTWTGANTADIAADIRYGMWSGTLVPNRIGVGVLQCKEAWNLDSKMDDGKPGMGVFTLHRSVSAACLNSTDRAAADYVFTSSANNALIGFVYSK